jgi:hypothetical protein
LGGSRDAELELIRIQSIQSGSDENTGKTVIEERRDAEAAPEGPPEHGVSAKTGGPNPEAQGGGMGHPISMLKT